MATFREVFGVGEFRALFVAQSVTVIGDQFARVALSVLVYQRTASAGLTALTYALTFLPDLVGGPLLSGVADRRPRRRVMIGADVVRAVLVAVMAVPGVPLWAVAALLVAVQLAGAPGGAARAALLPHVLEGERYPVGQAALNTVTQFAQVVGFAGGGALVVLLGTGGVLLADAVSFALSALLVWRWVRPRPAAAAPGGEGSRWLTDVAAGAALVWGDPRLRALVAFACLSGFYITGEALAAPYSAALGAGPVAVGLLFSACALGTAIGMVLVARLATPVRVRWMPALAVVSCAPLVLCLTRPDLLTTLLLFTVSGLGSAYQLVASTEFVRAVPDARRGQAFGLAVTALKVSQGLGVAAAGLAAERVPPHDVVAAAGAAGVVAALGVTLVWHRSWGAGGARARNQPPRGGAPTQPARAGGGGSPTRGR
ncbi:MFS transporter, partial [Umezawaea beigongshangensis]|uniref:MFS transporter n=1 Tax=Umezawaea beigongshangensis TaxID=2780383 RepID=UPI0027DD0367